MCGIAGIWNFGGQPVPQSTIDRFTDSLAHRGPDGQGIWFDDTCGVAFGHCRLAILDLSDNGKQPMSYSNERYWITYNGEIYNFIELRRKLEKKGYVFRTDTDTEVILASYIEWGPEMLEKFNGMWAFAIFDRLERLLFVARDRFGIKPFHYYISPGLFAFASELKAFTRLQGPMPEIDRETAWVLLNDPFQVEASQKTLLKGVRRLQAGHYGIIRHGNIKIFRWWNTLDHLILNPSTLENPSEHFRNLFYDSVKLRMRSDVPIATCLSGGFDSTSVVCALSDLGSDNSALRQAKEWQTAFVACFPGASNDERNAAELAIRFAGIKGIFLDVKESDAMEEIDRILYDFDDVYIGIPTASWLIYRCLRMHKRFVSLDGHGADELMGGYRPLDYLSFQNAPSFLTSPLKNLALINNYLRYSGESPSTPYKDIMGLIAGLLRNHPSFLPLKKAIKTLKYSSQMISKPKGFLRDALNIDKADFALQCGADLLPEHWGNENRHLYTLFHSTLLPTILRNFDRVSMAHGVEVRMPFMDWRLVTFLFSLPDESKIGDGFTKRVARIAMKGRMPEKIRSARFKVGFNSPMPEWMNGVLGKWSMNLLENNCVADNDMVDIVKLKDFVGYHTSRKNWTWSACNAAWPYLNYLWFESHFLTQK
jgi:asparagine synthase (glutamine-hydrolysing)